MFDSPRCFACGGAYHPATGHWWGPTFPDVFYCGACYRPFIDWFRRHSARRWGKLRFYDETETSRNRNGGPDAWSGPP